MTIHSDHPFLPPDDERRPARRLRGRLPAPVTVLATGAGAARAGLTVSSLLLADGEPARVLALVDEESSLAEALGSGHGTTGDVPDDRTGPAAGVAVSVLGWEQRAVADVFAGVAPSPGGMFRTGTWSDTAWGPVLADCPAWAGCRVEAGELRRVGWSLLLELTVEHVEVRDGGAEQGSAAGPAADQPDGLVHRRGRYLRV